MILNNLRRRTCYFFAVVTLLLSARPASAQTKEELTRILFVFDGSQSMYGRWDNESKLDIASRLLNQLVDSLKNFGQVQLALRAYGHTDPVVQGNRNCQDTKLEVPFGKNNHAKIKEVLNGLRPKGTTLIAYSLEKSANDFTPCSNCRNIIILITDGIEECDGDPCLVSMNLQKRNIILKPFVIGMGLDKSVIEQFKCVGNFFDVQNKDEFRSVLGVIISQAMNTTSVQVNLLDKQGNPTETDVGITFYDDHSGEFRYHFIHSLNHRGLPDTLPIDPLGSYKLKVHTVPSVEKNHIRIQAGIHNIIAVDAGQGMLVTKTIGNNEYKDLKVIVRKSGTMETLNIQSFDEVQKYLVGKYDLEILTLPRLKINDVNVLQSHTAKVEIPGPGVVTFYLQSTGIAEIYEIKGQERFLIYRFNTNSMRETLVMQPGRYEIGYRPKNSKSSMYTRKETFEVSSGQSVQVKL